MRFGIDLGGTKTEIIALGSKGEELLRRRIPTVKNDYQKTVESICTLVFDAEKELGAKGTVGMGIPGTISPATGLVKNANSTWLNGMPFDKDLSNALNRPIKICNDADCLALSEATDGAGKGYDIVWSVIIGTGAGSGITAYGKLVTGPNAIGGEWGHNPLPWQTEEDQPLPKCYCGKHGCNETFISGTGLERDYEKHNDKKLKAFEIVKLAEGGDKAADEALQRYEDRLARATASVINVIDPHVVVLGGGMSNCERLYDTVPKLWPKYVFSDKVDTILKKSLHGDSSGVRGAAWLWQN
ncbi:MAG: ROK family protein [Alphaproteobacteria bacterium]